MSTNPTIPEPSQEYPNYSDNTYPGMYDNNQGWSQPPLYPYEQGKIEHPNAALILILGIGGLLVPMVSFLAWFMGNNAVKQERAGLYRPSQSVQIGRVLGLVFSILQIAAFVLITIMVLLGGALFMMAPA